MGQFVITREIRVALGRFAPGHLGELTQQVPFEMVDAVLAQTGAVQSRIRVLPARVVVYLLLAGCLFAELGYGQVWHRLVAGLDGLAVAHPSPAALTQARRRLGAAPLRALFDLLRGPAAVPGAAAGVRWRGLLVCAIDGTIMTVADSPANLAVFTKQRGGATGGSSYPMLRLVALVSCGTRSVIDAVFGPITSGETSYARQLLASLRPGMIVLADRNFGAGALAAQICHTQAEFLIRVRTDRTGPKLPALRRHRDGSYCSRFGGVPVRVIDAQITVATRAGRATSGSRLITTLADPRRYPAHDLVTLYHQRWDIETAYAELKSTILGGRVLRARTPPAWTRRSTPCWSPTRSCAPPWPTPPAPSPAPTPTGPASPSPCTPPATSSSRPQASSPAPPTSAGNIGRRLLANPMPSRRLRVSTRTVKRAISKYNARGPTINRATHQATITIDLTAHTGLTTSGGP